MSHYEKIPDLLDNLLACSMAEAARRVGISPSLPWNWLVQSRLGKPELQEIEFCGVLAPFHVHYSQNIPALTAHQIQQTALERARDGVLVDVFFQGQRMLERVLKEEYADIKEDELWIESAPIGKRSATRRKPTKQWLKPSDALVIKMLESWNRKRYGAHQTIDVQLWRRVAIRKGPNSKARHRASGASVRGRGVRRQRTARRPSGARRSGEVESRTSRSARHPANSIKPRSRSAMRWTNRRHCAPTSRSYGVRRRSLRRMVLVHRQPSHHVEIFKPDERDKAVTAEDKEPEPQTLARPSSGVHGGQAIAAAPAAAL